MDDYLEAHMKKMTKSRFLFWAAIVSAVAALAVSAPGADDLQKGLRGEVFTNPSRTLPMPEEWVKKPIKYEKAAEQADLVIVMDQDIYHALLPLIQKFGNNNNLKIIVKEGTCGIVSGMLAAKTADMGGYCCPPGKEDRLPGLKFHTMGIVAKAFFVHPDNQIDSISSSDLRMIYRGKISRWSDIKTQTGLPAVQAGRPGPDLAIKAIGRLHCKKRPGHWRQLLDDEKEFGTRLYEVGSIPDMIAQTAASKDAIGWEVLTMVEKYKNLGKVKPVKVDGYSPNDSRALASLKYPFYRTYTLSKWEGKGIENKNVLKLVNYMMKEFDKLDPDRFGFVSQRRLKEAGWKFIGDELVGEPR